MTKSRNPGNGIGQPARASTDTLSKGVNVVSKLSGSIGTSASTAYERVIDALQDLGYVRQSGDSRAQARCLAHDDHSPSLSIRAADDRVLIHCHAGCDTPDVLAQLRLTPAELFDDHGGSGSYEPDPEALARAEARKSMTPVQKRLDDLLHLPDLGERLCLAIARIRPELYISEREGLEPDSPLPLDEPDRKRDGTDHL